MNIKKFSSALFLLATVGCSSTPSKLADVKANGAKRTVASADDAFDQKSEGWLYTDKFNMAVEISSVIPRLATGECAIPNGLQMDLTALIATGATVKSVAIPANKNTKKSITRILTFSDNLGTMEIFCYRKQ